MRNRAMGAVLCAFAGCQGPAGPEGPPGVAGLAGEDGAPGRAGQVTQPDRTATSSPPTVAKSATYMPLVWIGCSVAVDVLDESQDIRSTSIVGRDGTAETGLSYDVTGFSNGDSNVQCSAGYGNVESASASAYLPKVTNAGATAQCLVGIDYPPYLYSPGEVGGWRFEIKGGDVTAEYHDIDRGHPLDGAKYRYEENDCHAYVTDMSGEWQPRSLGELFK